jgi:dihydrofolate synthase / folylpolyglutamate synthase
VRFTRLEDWLRWQETCHASAIDLGLERVRSVAEQLDLLRPTARIITIAGTNGKGSCAAAIEALLVSGGQTCGVFTSPHVLRYNERVKIAGEFAKDEDLCRAFARVEEARGDITLTYFEFGTLAALWLFAERQLPFWVLEVGLGGRLDATNILDPDVAIITSIALDHMEWLGNDRESIGREKAGICRRGVPLVCADPAPPQSVLDTADKLNCPLYLVNRDFGFRDAPGGTEFWCAGATTAPLFVQLPKPSLAAAWQAVSLLKTAETQPQALASLSLPGRLQSIQAGARCVFLDVAHNPAAMAYLAERLKGQKVMLVIAMMADKNLHDSLVALESIAGEWCLTTIAHLPRAASTKQLHEALPQAAVAKIFDSVSQALEWALASASDLPVLVTGSFYTVAEATLYLQSDALSPESEQP